MPPRKKSAATPAKKPAKKPASASAPIGFEQKLWQAVDALRNNMDAAEYKHVVLGLLFLKYISDAFEAKLRLMVKKILKKHGYPPDLQEKATDTVLEQADLLTAEWVAA